VLRDSGPFPWWNIWRRILPIEEVLRTRRGIKRWFAHCGRVYFFFHFFFLYFFKFCFAEESFYDFLLLVSKVESNAKCQLLNIGALYSWFWPSLSLFLYLSPSQLVFIFFFIIIIFFPLSFVMKQWQKLKRQKKQQKIACCICNLMNGLFWCRFFVICECLPNFFFF